MQRHYKIILTDLNQILNKELNKENPNLNKVKSINTQIREVEFLIYEDEIGLD